MVALPNAKCNAEHRFSGPRRAKSPTIRVVSESEHPICTLDKARCWFRGLSSVDRHRVFAWCEENPLPKQWDRSYTHIDYAYTEMCWPPLRGWLDAYFG